MYINPGNYHLFFLHPSLALITIHYLYTSQFRPPIALRTACRASDTWREKMASSVLSFDLIFTLCKPVNFATGCEFTTIFSVLDICQSKIYLTEGMQRRLSWIRQGVFTLPGAPRTFHLDIFIFWISSELEYVNFDFKRNLYVYNFIILFMSPHNYFYLSMIKIRQLTH